jgi:hypothetical protein
MPGKAGGQTLASFIGLPAKVCRRPCAGSRQAWKASINVPLMAASPDSFIGR